MIFPTLKISYINRPIYQVKVLLTISKYSDLICNTFLPRFKKFNNLFFAELQSMRKNYNP